MRRKREEKSWTKAISGDRGWHGLVREQARARAGRGGRGRRTRKRNDRGLRWFFSVAADSQLDGRGELLECIMHAKWRGFLQITGAAPLPDEGVLR